MKILVFLALLSTSFFSQAEGRDGNELLEYCQAAVDVLDNTTTEKINLWKGYSCLSYVQGLIDMNALYSSGDFKKKDKKYFCIPSAVTSAQNIRVILKYLKDNPQDLHHPRYVLGVSALRTAFPCKV
jgi:hypothetical protein